MADSALVTKFIQAYSGNYTKNRMASGGKISEITIHHVAAMCSIEDLGRLWQTVGRLGSSHYGVSVSGVGQYVREADIAWTNSNWQSNCRAVTIETANSGKAPDWPVADSTMSRLVDLVADIAKRNRLGTLIVGKNLTYHSMYTATACPGPFLRARLAQIAERANAKNASDEWLAKQGVGSMKMSTRAVSMKLGAMSGGDLLTMKALLESLAIGCTINGAYIDTAKISPSDQDAILQKATSLVIGYEPLFASGEGTISQEIYDAAIKRAESAEAIALPFKSAIAAIRQ